MAFIDIDFTVPIVLLASAIAGVVLVRQLTQWGARRAKARTRALVEAFGGPPGVTGPREGIDEVDPAS